MEFGIGIIVWILNTQISQDLSYYKNNRITVCLFVCLSVPKDLCNRWIDMVLLFRRVPLENMASHPKFIFFLKLQLEGGSTFPPPVKCRFEPLY